MAEAIAALGLAATIIQVIDFSSRLAHRLEEFRSFVGEVPESFRHISIRLPLLTDTLKQIKANIDRQAASDSTTSVTASVVAECQKQLTVLQEILDRTVPPPEASSWERRKKAFVSLGSDKKVEAIAKALGQSLPNILESREYYTSSVFQGYIVSI